MGAGTTAIGAVAIGASAGGLGPLKRILAELPASYPRSVLIVQHGTPTPRPLLPDLLQAVCKLRVMEADDKQPLKGGVYIAPAGYHLYVEPTGTLSLSVDEPVRYARPSIDVLFESAAEVFGERLIAVILSGANSDGADGIVAVKRAGGVTVAQSLEEAEAQEMPRSAIATGAVDHVLPASAIGQFLAEKPGAAS